MSVPSIAAIRSVLVPEVRWPTKAIGWAEFVVAAVFGVCMPLFLVFGSAEYIIKSDWLYTYDWWRNGIPTTSGLTVDQLNSASNQIKDYFSNDVEYLDVEIQYQGRSFALFKQREILHMKDVKGLMKGVFKIVRVSGAAALLITIVGLLYLRGKFWGKAFTALRWSALGAGTIVAILSLAIIINFDWVFTEFHVLSFANDLWELDPNTDYLLIMFPERFFLETTVLIAVFAVAQFAILMWVVRLLRRRYGGAGDQSPAITGSM